MRETNPTIAGSMDLAGFSEKAMEIARYLLSARSVDVVSHIDADGITAAAIADVALTRAGIPHQINFLKKLDEVSCHTINAMTSECVWMTDLGSGYTSRIEHAGLVICDHHPWEGRTSVEARPKRDLFDYHDNTRWHLNPHLYGYNGSVHLSGAGAAYWVARSMASSNRDLSVLAIVGALGDFQDNAERRLVGLNSSILDDARALGLVKVERDLRLFGRETKPITKLFQHSNDPTLPGLSNDWYGTRKFLIERCRIRLYQGSRSDAEGKQKERTWSDLDEEERQRVRDELAVCMEKQGALDALERCYGEVYILTMERPGTELREGKEFATLLNSCGRYGKESLGLSVCLAAVHDGNTTKEGKAQSLEQALAQLRNHRENLIEAMGFFFSEERKGPFCERRKGVQLLVADGSYLLPEKVRVRGNAGTEEREVFRDTTVGILVGMVLSSGKVKDDLPLMAMMRSEGKVKASARGNRRMIERGLDLSSAMREAAAQVGGSGGGHDIAAGATVPEEKVNEFIAAVDRIITGQLSRK